MQINKLFYFITVCKYLSFTKAAEECHTAQSAISQQIKSLENELGFELFIRTSRNVQLTECGKIFYKNIKSIMDDYDNAVKKAQSAAFGYKGTLTIGICGGIEEIILPNIIKKFSKEYPLIEISFKKARTGEISKELENYIYDAVFTWPYDFENSKTIENKVFFKDNVCVMMSRENRLSKKTVLTKKEISSENNIMISYKENSNTYKHFCSFYSDDNLKPKSVSIVSDSNILNLMVDLNMGISIVPKSFKNSENKNMAFADIENCNHDISFSIAYLKRNSNPCLKLFLEEIHQ